MLRRLQFFNIFTAKCVFATAACNFSTSEFFDIRTAKSAPKTTVFQHFHCQMCFRHSSVQFFDIRIFRHQKCKKCSEDYSFSTFSLPNVLFATAAYNCSTSELQKVLRRLQFFNIFTAKCAFGHSGVQLFDIRTSKSAPKTTVFQHFHFQMCFSPQRRAIFRHLNFKKWSRIVSFLTFSLPNVLFATAACNFSTSELQKVVPDRQFFNMFTSQCGFRHSGVHIFHI